MASKVPKHILIAPLDWGMGHTTRCVPIIRHLLAGGHKVTVAGNSGQLDYYSATIGAIGMLELEGYNISFSAWNRVARLGLLWQVPGIIRSIKNEHSWLQQVLAGSKIDGVIADNRYGLYNSSVPCVIMTHQLNILSGMGPAADAVVQKLHYRYLNRFDQTWIADDEKANLAGRLSQAAVKPKGARYTGLLSCYGNAYAAGRSAGNAGKDGPVLVLLSGPEPQRTALADRLWAQVKVHSGQVHFVEGSPGKYRNDIPPHVQHYDRLTPAVLEGLLQTAAIVVCRSGYSTLMDLAALGKKAILIPTPGQTEQEYLAERLGRAGLYHTARQRGFELQAALRSAAALPERQGGPRYCFDAYKHVVDEWIAGINEEGRKVQPS